MDQVRLFVPEVWTNGTLPGVSLEAAPTWIVDHNAASLSGETDHQLGLHVKSVAPNTVFLLLQPPSCFSNLPPPPQIHTTASDRSIRRAR